MYDILFISNGRSSDIAWEELHARFPRAQRLENVDSFEIVKNKSLTKFFYVVWDDVIIAEDFNFDYKIPVWDEQYLHIFKNNMYYDGICLLSKNHKVSDKEFFNRFFFGKKEIDIIASYPRPSNYEIVFISYDEPNADINFSKLENRFPNVKRIHGVKGIHRAHIQAASLVSTQMFYVVDGDAEVFDNFNFDYYVPTFQRDIVHVWQSVNPINNLIYGYGGVKLLPRDKVLSMSTETVDMTLKISDKFKCVPEISNLTRFNTDEFNTWKSAFRECVKLASKPIDENYDEENDRRLKIWCSVGENQLYGQIAIEGAIEGKKYGYAHIYNHEQLYKINDFDWLKSIYEQRTKDSNT
jgi:hypothetical protein